MKYSADAVYEVLIYYYDSVKSKCRRQRVFCGRGHFLCDVRVVPQSELQFGMPQHFLHITGIEAVFRQHCGVGMPQIMELEVDTQVLFDDTGEKLCAVGSQHFAVSLDIDEVRDFDDLFFLRLAPVGHEVAFVPIAVQLAALRRAASSYPRA